MNTDGGPPPDEGPHDPWLEARVSRLEDDMGEIRGTLHRLEPMIIRMDATMAHLATRAGLQALGMEMLGLRTEVLGIRTELKSDIADVKVALADKPSRLYMWGIVTAMVAAFACGLAGLAVVK